MTTIDRSTKAESRLYRLNTDQFEAMIRAGVFPDDIRVELLGGLLVSKMTKLAPQVTVVGRLMDTLQSLLKPGWFLNIEQPVELDRHWRPEPDLSLIRGQRTDFAEKLPGPENLLFLVEVAETSSLVDRGRKWRGYASAGVATYWIVNLSARRVEVHTDPDGHGKHAVYRAERFYAEDAEVPVVIEGHEVGRIAVKDILP